MSHEVVWGRRVDAVVAVALTAAALIAFWPVRDLPYHWDAAMFVVPAARDLLATRFSPFVAGHSDFAHPPVFMALLALAWTAFGNTRVISHAVVFPFLPIAAVGTYALGKRVADRSVGCCAAALFVATPVVLEELGQIFTELPAAAAIVWALVAWRADRALPAAALFSVAALVRIPTLVVPAALFAIELGRAVLPGSPREPASAARMKTAARLVALGLPFATVAGWLVYHHAAAGFWLVGTAHRKTYVPQGAVGLAHNVGAVAFDLLLAQGRFVLPLTAAVALSLSSRARDRRSLQGPLGLLAPVLAGTLFFAVFGEFAQRYGIFLLPLSFLAFLTVSRSATADPVPLAATTAGALVVFARAWHPRLPLTVGYDFAPPQDLGYLDVIAIGVDSARYVEANLPDAEVYGSVPESYELTRPYEGYVTSPHSVAPCSSFVPHPGKTQVLFRHPYSPGQVPCAELVLQTGSRFLRRFVSNGKWVELYVVPRAVGKPSEPP